MTSSSDPVTTSTPNAHAAIKWTWQRGGTASVVRIDGLHLEVHSTVPYPPGAPLNATSDAGTSFEVKVRGCRKLPSGQFAITGAFVNLTRDLRASLVAALEQPAEHQSQ